MSCLANLDCVSCPIDISSQTAVWQFGSGWLEYSRGPCHPAHFGRRAFAVLPLVLPIMQWQTAANICQSALTISQPCGKLHSDSNATPFLSSSPNSVAPPTPSRSLMTISSSSFPCLVPPFSLQNPRFPFLGPSGHLYLHLFVWGECVCPCCSFRCWLRSLLPLLMSSPTYSPRTRRTTTCP